MNIYNLLMSFIINNLLCNRLGRTLNSSFRAPLAEYLEHIPKEAADFFFDRLAQPSCFNVFLYVLDNSPALRAEVIDRKGPSERGHLLAEMVTNLTL
jgi:hypothetical protein